MQVDHTKNIIEVKDASFNYGDEKVLKDITLNMATPSQLAKELVLRGNLLGVTKITLIQG